MVEYVYKCRDGTGRLVNGTRVAKSEQALAKALHAEKLIPVEILEKPSGFKLSFSFKLPEFRSKKVSKDDLQMFCRQMHTLLKAGIPLIISVTRLAETARDKTLAETLRKVVARLNEGRELSGVLREFNATFSNFFINLVKVGESTGNMDRIFLFIATYLELEIETKKKIKTATRYPMFVLVATFVALIVINVFVVPSFAKMFESAKMSLPLPTRILIGTSNFIIHYWYVLIATVVLCVSSLKYYCKTARGAMQWASLQLRIPIFGWLIHRIILARFTRLYALVLKAGISALDGINMVGQSTGNLYMESKVKEVTSLIARGNSIASAISQTKLFPPLVIQMMTLGEESGQIDSMLEEVSDFYEREIDYDLLKIGDAIEPILLLVMAAMVLVLALGVFLPMWDMASMAK